MTKRELSRKMAELGRAGAAARTKALSVSRRKEIASNAAKARWANRYDVYEEGKLIAKKVKVVTKGAYPPLFPKNPPQ